MLLFKSKIAPDAYVVRVATDEAANKEYNYLLMFWVRQRALLARLEKYGVRLPSEFERWPQHFPNSAIYLCELAKFVDRAELRFQRAAA